MDGHGIRTTTPPTLALEMLILDRFATGFLDFCQNLFTKQLFNVIFVLLQEVKKMASRGAAKPYLSPLVSSLEYDHFGH